MSEPPVELDKRVPPTSLQTNLLMSLMYKELKSRAKSCCCLSPWDFCHRLPRILPPCLRSAVLCWARLLFPSVCVRTEPNHPTDWSTNKPRTACAALATWPSAWTAAKWRPLGKSAGGSNICKTGMALSGALSFNRTPSALGLSFCPQGKDVPSGRGTGCFPLSQAGFL